ncbi:hypothetical protein NUW58_g7854 [Xylaria curta]|uniref:Uncharacterized protein n=1 Tax=Xylaria curta TaxID=42375 RepID=A0ACC1NFV3_9PEZI|nr:hypothetical protein NUW58_g7854 [Xylaria curta]
MAYIWKIDEQIEAVDDSEGGLTCGVEIEFLVPSIPVTAEDPDPEIKNQHLHRSTSEDDEDISTEIRRQLLKTLQQLTDIPFRAMEEDDFHPPHDNVVIYDSWRLGQDMSLSSFQFADSPYHWTACELTSSVMDADDYAQQIQDVCRALKTTRIYFNRSTAVHVHVGRGNEPFSLNTVKKFATLYWLTEKAILKLHHPSRHNNEHCFRLNHFSALAAKSEGRATMADHVPVVPPSELRYNQLHRIWGCGSIEEVARLMEGAKRQEFGYDTTRGSVGFRRFLPAGKTGGNIQTFEWRQMSSSADAKYINQWIKACVAFTDFCRRSSPTTFIEVVGKVVRTGEDYSAIELLEELGIDTEIFKEMLQVWTQDPSLSEDYAGRRLLLAIDPEARVYTPTSA